MKNANGTNILNKLGLLANTTYLDTVNLPLDCYTFRLIDVGDDGLSWWANTAQGTGYMRIRNGYTGAIIKTFNPDFGDNIYQQFTVNFTLPVPEIQQGEGILKVFPNPANDLITAEFSLPVYGQARLQLLNMLGQVLISQDIVASQVMEKSVMDVSTLSPGVYYVSLQSGDKKRVQKVVITR